MTLFKRTAAAELERIERERNALPRIEGSAAVDLDEVARRKAAERLARPPLNRAQRRAIAKQMSKRERREFVRQHQARR
jgi:hypothetical protein